MNNWSESILAVYKTPYFIAQTATIVALFLLGFLLVNMVMCHDKGNRLINIALAFPTGVSLFVVVGYIFLVVGIPYKIAIIGPVIGVIAIVLLAFTIKRERENINSRIIIYVLVGLLVVIGLAAIATSGVFSMSVSNDSLYYFWQYPRAICYYEGLRDQFDNFLTDTGLGAAVIGTLPFLVGFGQTFGIQEFFHISFILFFGCSVYECINYEYPQLDDKKACVISAAMMILLAVTTPVYILAHWAMSNMFFMEVFYIGLYLVIRMGRNGYEECRFDWIILALVLFMCATVRTEGGIFVLFILLASGIANAKAGKVVLSALPIVVLQSCFEAKIFITYVIDNPYIFMTPLKAGIQFLAYVGVILYLMVIKGRLPEIINKITPAIIICVLILVNALLLVINPTVYIANLKAFAGNLTGQSGWGMLPYLTAGALIILIYWEFIQKNIRSRMVSLISCKNGVALWIFLTIGFFLVALAVSFARGDALNVNTGDSGNRVLLQIAPIVLVTFVMWFTDLCAREETNGKQ